MTSSCSSAAPPAAPGARQGSYLKKPSSSTKTSSAGIIAEKVNALKAQGKDILFLVSSKNHLIWILHLLMRDILNMFLY